METTNRRSTQKMDSPERRRRRGSWRDKLALWLLGVATKFGFVVLFSAANDILHTSLPEVNRADPPRDCCMFSTSVVLFAIAVPAYISRVLLPLVPKWYNSLATFSFLLSLTGFFILAWVKNIYAQLGGVALTSLAFGIGDWILGSYSSLYEMKVNLQWKSSIKVVGVFASFSYAALCELKISLSNIFLAMFSLPLVGLFCYWFLLRSPMPPILTSSSLNSEYPLSIFSLEVPLLYFKDKCAYFGHLCKYMLPLGFEIIMQSFINQGLYEFIYFRGNSLSIDSQYRWYLFIYNVGFLACTITKNIVDTDSVGIFSFLQFFLSFIFICEAIFNFMPYLWAIFLMIYFEGIISGAVYVNVITEMYVQEPSNRFGIAENAIKQCIWLCMIFGAAFGTVVHYFLSYTPEPPRP